MAVITIWKEVGLSMIFYMAGLLAIPTEYYEAAKVDGSTNWNLFRHITLPLLRGTHVFVLITTTISAFGVFARFVS
ncbi:MAG: sugar ABC transporter permease [Chloroflexi bacterium]|nr:sugar ABC transporter permease [Chloroflexota bacterium]